MNDEVVKCPIKNLNNYINAEISDNDKKIINEIYEKTKKIAEQDNDEEEKK